METRRLIAMMKTPLLLWLCQTGFLAASQPDSTDALKTFARYEQGSPLAWVADARAAVLHQSHDPAIRALRERELLGFLKSDATMQSKAIALQWLGVIGGPESSAVLEDTGNTPELRESAAAAMLRIRGIPPADESKASHHSNLDRVAAFTSALATASPSDADKLLTEALHSSDERTALAALLAIRRGAGSPRLTETILANVAPLSENDRTRVLAALGTRTDAAPALRPWLLRLVREGDGAERTAAAQALTTLLEAADVELLLEMASTAKDKEPAAAARAALRGAGRKGVDEALTAVLTNDSALRPMVIELLAARNATGAVEAIWKLVDDPAAEVSGAASKALGMLIPVQQLDQCVDRLLTASTEAQRSTLGSLVWEVARRHPELHVAAEILRQAADDAPAPLKEPLRTQSERLENRGATVVPVAPVPDDRPGLLPNGSEDLIRLDSGTTVNASRKDVRIRRIEGTAYQFGDAALPQATVDFGATVSYEITGLDAAGTFLLGITAWDADNGGRIQSLSIDGEPVLPKFHPLAWHEDKPTHMRLQVPVPAKAASDGKITVTIKCLAGPNAVVSEVWLTKRNREAHLKRVVIITGDDHPAHHWRETGPEFASLLRADPRLEVSICESPFLLSAPGLQEFDAVFLHFKNYQNRLPLEHSQWKGLEQFVRNGGGLVVAHFGCGACQEWPGFVQIAGRIWDPKKRAHDPYGDFFVRVAGINHPVTRGLADFNTTDELYTCLTGDPDISVLAESTSSVDHSVHPMAFTLTPGKGRVFHCTLGHDLKALKSQGTRQLYLRGTQWAAGVEERKP
ncbi:MAG: ThuA domain-containing protein [Verrucomicrobiales bacterium]|nr:ThuA domain-containing protein [Verrucomicrobiales bacterium]